MKRKIIFFCCICFLSSCGLALHIVSSRANQNAEINDTQGKTNVTSPNNEDNAIYKTNRIFCYEVEQTQKGRHIRFALDMMVIPGSFNANQSKIKYNYHYNPIDLDTSELRLFGFDGQGKFSPEFTSLKEEKNVLYFHPPRSKTLVCLEAAPFPEVPYQIKKGTSKKVLLFIPRGSWGKLGGSKITWKYEIDSVIYHQDTIPYFCSIKAQADSKRGGHNTLQMHFNADSGFTRLSYRFQDSTAIDFTLKEIK